MDQDKTIVPLVSVTFIASSSPYHPPDVAGFPKHEADALVKAGKARYTEQAGDDADRSEADRLAAEQAEADRLAAEKAAVEQTASASVGKSRKG